MNIKLITLIAAITLSGCTRAIPQNPAANTGINTNTNTTNTNSGTNTNAAPKSRSIVSLSLSNSEDKRVDLVTAEGDFASASIENLYNIHVLHTGVVGRFGCPVEITAADFHSGQIRFKYRPLEMNGVPPENLIVLHYNEETSFYDTIPSTLDKDNTTVYADMPGYGVYMLADKYEWNAVWGEDTSAYSHPIEYKNEEYNFVFTIPNGLTVDRVSDYLKDDEDGQYKELLRSDYNGTLKLGAEYLLRPNSSSVKDYLNALADTAAQNGDIKARGELTTKYGEKGYYFFVDFGDTAMGRAYSVNCMYEYKPSEYINFWYGFTDESTFEDVKASLESFGFLNK